MYVKRQGGTHYVAQENLKFIICLPQHPKHWDYRSISLCPEAITQFKANPKF